jgi:serine/threonine protein kinase/tetratricopeptide (TPR) repeat protein
MTPEYWQQIDYIFQEALQHPPHQRAALLDEACADEELRKEIESLISFHQQAESFLEAPVFEAAARLFFEDRAESLTGLAIGPYKIGAQLGAGGMGEVYLAEDTKLDRKVAIKFLPLYLEADEQARMRLIREARAAAKLDHPNICATYEVAQEDSHSFIVMQYVQGETLASRIQREPLELREALDVAVQVADALAEAHSHGIIHRDIKPQNIMITPRGQVKVLDFGLAKAVQAAGMAQSGAQTKSQLSTPGIIVGTAPYMSPEQAKGASVDTRSDLFSLGVMLYECIAGRLPFSGVTPMEICAQVIHVNPPPPSHLNPHVPPDLDAVTLKALAKEPDARYQSACDLLEDLNDVRAALKAGDGSPGRLIPHKRGASSASSLVTAYKVVRRPRVFIPALVVLALALLSFNGARPWGRAGPHQPSLQAQRWYDISTRELHNGAYYDATKMLKLAVEEDNKYALAHAKLAEAWMELDYQDKAYKAWARVTELVPDRSTLPLSDALYLDAINFTLTQNFADAVEGHKKIVQQTPDSDKAYAYVDLGRAYEKNDELDKAIESYQKAKQLAPKDPAAFLRLGILYTQKGDEANALEAFQKAEEHYRDMSDYEGIVEVLYQRGMLFNDRDKRADARAQLEYALNILHIEDNPQQKIKILLELSRAAYTGGQTAQAEQYAKTAIDLAQANGTENLITQGLIELGNLLRSQGEYSKADIYLRQALVVAQNNEGLRNEAKARVSLGGLLITQHKADEGLYYVNQALNFYEKGGYRRDYARALYEVGRACEAKGEIELARQAFDKQLQLAQQVEDQSQMARAHRGIAVTLVYQEHYPEALRRFKDSYDIYNSLNNQFFAGNRLIDCGEMLWRLGHYKEAKEAFNRVAFITKQPGDKNKQMLDSLSLVEANMALSERRFLKAIKKGKQALALNEQNEHAVEAKYVIGLAQALSGAKREGRQMCEEAVKEATHTAYQPILSGALLALAEAMLEGDDAQGALTNALEAQARFRSAGQQESEWRALLVAARASLSTGDAMQARDYATRAEGVLSNLQQQWGTEAYNGYITRPDIEYYRKQLSQILSANR